MNLKTFLWDKTLAIVFNIIGIIAVGVFIGIAGEVLWAIIISVVWTAALVVYLIISYVLQKSRIKLIKKQIAKIDDKYLLSALISKPFKSEDRLYYELMLIQGKAAIEKVTSAEKEKEEYYEYLESWVHDIKTPIAAIRVICDNNQGSAFREIYRQLQKVHNLAEQLLFEAKSNAIEKDLLIKKTQVSEVINECIKENKQLFIDSDIRITTDIEGIVLTDKKWLYFILKQILINCVQYKRKDNAEIKIQTKIVDNEKVELSIWDNGIGITLSDLPRIFEKGFTGSNGRTNRKSTGFGLYLCKKLCDALSMPIFAVSKAGEYTSISLLLILA